jgi:hypothetical protein
MLKIFHRSGMATQTSSDSGVVRVEMSIPNSKESKTSTNN